MNTGTSRRKAAKKPKPAPYSEEWFLTQVRILFASMVLSDPMLTPRQLRGMHRIAKVAALRMEYLDAKK